MKPDLFNCFLLLITQHDVHDEEETVREKDKRKESESPSVSVEGEWERARCSRCFPPTLYRFHSFPSGDTTRFHKKENIYS